MYYGKRKKKTEPEKIYAELVFFLMLKSGFGVSIQDLEKVIKRSVKTYQRYACELLDTGEIDYIEYRPHDSVPTFSAQHLKNSGYSIMLTLDYCNISQPHIKKLKRLIELIKYIQSINPLDTTLIYPDDYNYYEIVSLLKYTDYKNVAGDYTIRTYQRDKKLIYSVFNYFEKEFLTLTT